MIICNYDLVDGWAFDGEASLDFGISFTNGPAERFELEELTFGYEIIVNKKAIESHSWPPAHIVIRELTPTRVFPYKLLVNAGSEVTLKVWASNNGKTVSGQTVWIVSRPPQPDPAWVWDSNLNAWVEATDEAV